MSSWSFRGIFFPERIGEVMDPKRRRSMTKLGKILKQSLGSPSLGISLMMMKTCRRGRRNISIIF
jgi:hypothetical protein